MSAENSTTEDASYQWHVVTCEFPPQIGGVSDYTLTLASALAATRCTHVWCPPAGVIVGEQTPGLFVHPQLGGFSAADLRRVGLHMNDLPGPRRLFVQWVPHGFGYRSVNVPFALWLLGRAWFRGDQLHVMVHEPFAPLSVRPDRLAAALVHRLMLTIACLGATKVWMSTPSWLRLIRPYLLGRTTPQWLPIPAPPLDATTADTQDPASRRTGVPLVGHFGTYSPIVTQLLGPALDVVLRDSSSRVLLVGRDSDRFRAAYVGEHRDLAARVDATGVLTPALAARALAACDVMLQPYPDGVSARRTSTLALLRMGLPVVTNSGHLCEPFWKREASVELVGTPDGKQLGEATLRLLLDPERRVRLASKAREMYATFFDSSQTIEILNTGSTSVPLESAHA